MDEAEQPRAGLRERKKAKTRAAIQQHALRLFRAQGYDATTVEQIADAAEVSPSTFFRYFPTKEDVAMYDALDPLMFASFEAQPPEFSPARALREAMHDVFASLPAAELQDMRARFDLIRAVPELRSRLLDEFMRTLRVIAELIAKRIGRPTDDFEARAFAGALIGVVMAAFVAADDDPNADLIGLMDAALMHLEKGLPL